MNNDGLNKATALCSKGEYCVSQIREKLRNWGVDEKDAEGIIKHLIDEKYIDEMRFCHAYVNDKFRYNHWGRLKIRQGLCFLRLPSENIAEALNDINQAEYLQTLSNILRQKNRSLHDKDSYVRKGKLMRHAISKGFETDLILRVVEEMLGGD